MPSRIDEAGHTKAFDYPVAEHWGGGEAEMFSSAGGTLTDNTLEIIKGPLLMCFSR